MKKIVQVIFFLFLLPLSGYSQPKDTFVVKKAALLLNFNNAIINHIDKSKFFTSNIPLDGEYFNIYNVKNDIGIGFSYYYNSFQKKWNMSHDISLNLYRKDIVFEHIQGISASIYKGKLNDVYLGYTPSVSWLPSNRLGFFFEAGPYFSILLKGSAVKYFDVNRSRIAPDFGIYDSPLQDNYFLSLVVVRITQRIGVGKIIKTKQNKQYIVRTTLDVPIWQYPKKFPLSQTILQFSIGRYF
jgi:hypothetical protein